MAEKQMGMDSWMKTMEDWFAKLPPLPANVKEVLVKVAPWLALVFGVLGVLASVAATGLMAALSPVMVLGGGVGVATGGVVGALLAVVGSVLMLVSFPGLRDRKMAGWKLAFWSEAVGVVSSVIALNLIGALISALVGFYLLFQIKSYYK